MGLDAGVDTHDADDSTEYKGGQEANSSWERWKRVRALSVERNVWVVRDTGRGEGVSGTSSTVAGQVRAIRLKGTGYQKLNRGREPSSKIYVPQLAW